MRFLVGGASRPCFYLVGRLQPLLQAPQSYSQKIGTKKCAKEESISEIGKTGISKFGKTGSANPFSGSAASRKKAQSRSKQGPFQSEKKSTGDAQTRP
jgi:hypothetical protein